MQIELSDYYAWELETVDGQIYSREHGHKWQDANPDEVMRASLVPVAPGLPRHDVFCHADNQFRKWFGKGFIKWQSSGFKLNQYAHCIETDQARLWVLTDGRTLTTHIGFNLRI